MIFMRLCAGTGKAGSRSKCTENTHFCSAMSTKGEIGAKVGQMPLVTSSAAESEMKRRVELFIPYFSSFLMIILMTMYVGMGLGGMGL